MSNWILSLPDEQIQEGVKARKILDSVGFPYQSIPCSSTRTEQIELFSGLRCYMGLEEIARFAGWYKTRKNKKPVNT